ncbi:MAG: hypothetical protein JWQ38_2554, partial [Flavipsychrobacter sp.]|nr:hypothetical protein [Flavipsychrobacter sp.]
MNSTFTHNSAVKTTHISIRRVFILFIVCL